ncbi:Transposase DDE domain-containing protein [Bradyrhizobium arachidis]|nr:Transposase DDE domain-containing protein [Bradyrhizobium arachidis]
MAPPRALINGGANRSVAAGPIKPTSAEATHLPSGQKTGGLRITTAIGEVKLNFHKVTNGLAHGTTPGIAGARGAASAHDNTSVWSGGQGGSSAVASTSTSPSNSGNGGSIAGASGSANSGSTAPPSSVVGPAVIPVADAPVNSGKGPGGDLSKKCGSGAANAAGGNGPGGKGPPGHGPAGNGLRARPGVAMAEVTGTLEVMATNQGQRTSRPWALRRRLLRTRHLIECCFSKLKWFRRVATRYERTARNYLAIVTIAATLLWLRQSSRRPSISFGVFAA